MVASAPSHLAVRGRLDRSTAPAIGREIDRRIAPGSALELDLSEVTSIDTAAIRTLVGAHGRAITVGCGWHLTAPRNPSARRRLEVGGVLRSPSAAR